MNEEEKKLIEEFAGYLIMSFDKGMRIQERRAKSPAEKRRVRAIYSQFIDAIPVCVESFCEWKEYEKE